MKGARIESHYSLRALKWGELLCTSYSCENIEQEKQMDAQISCNFFYVHRTCHCVPLIFQKTTEVELVIVDESRSEGLIGHACKVDLTLIALSYYVSFEIKIASSFERISACMTRIFLSFAFTSSSMRIMISNFSSNFVSVFSMRLVTAWWKLGCYELRMISNTESIQPGVMLTSRAWKSSEIVSCHG